MASIRQVFEERLETFRESYTFHPHDEVVRSLAVTGEIISLISGDQVAARAMTAIEQILEGPGTPRSDDDGRESITEDWREKWAEMEGYDLCPDSVFLDELLELSAFAEQGILPVWDFAEPEVQALPEARNLTERLEASANVPAWIEGICAKADRLERLGHTDESGRSCFAELLATRDLARARLKYDRGEPITIYELALLSGVTPKRVQNAIYAKTDEAPIVDKNNLINPDTCEAWLSARDYVPSMWKQVSKLFPLEKDWGRAVELEGHDACEEFSDFLFVPIANDGSIFLPDVCRENREGRSYYQVGGKGEEEVFFDYEEALEKLQKIDPPKWRRPNPDSGKWGIVAGRTWKRVRRAEILGER